jgi:GT2 family glycosyltransferase
MRPALQLSIIIVNWNSKDYVRKCLHSVYANTSGIAFEIIVVDGASYDGCGEMLAREFPQVRFVQSEKNVGFGRANNLGFEYSRGESILFLNPDTELEGSAINVLYAALASLKDAGIVGARLLNTDGSLQMSCVQAFPTILNQFLVADVLMRAFPRLSFWGTAPLFDTDRPMEAEMLSGACLMLRRTVFEKIGKFSSDYFMYSEDLDLCYQSRRAGCKNYHVPAAIIIHHGSGSSQQSQSDFSEVMMRESIYRFLTKIHGKCYGAVFRASVSVNALGRLTLIALLLPFQIARGGQNPTRNSFRKWKAILRWTLGLESWVGNYS